MAVARILALATGTTLVLGAMAVQPTICSAAGRGAAEPSMALQKPQVGPALGGLTGATGYAVSPVKVLRLDPLAQSSADPLSNAVALEPDGPKDQPVSTTLLTDSLSHGGGVGALPVVGTAAGLLPG
ncbi:hypothetical protein [Streptacidiphilus carbonis]|jgi:hypothetical protein|uniref:hypothetical protein n=1 Tax=Streptacidiphilus carbonis TaxID=105422 RepID=UPI0006937DB8|nr:hypothetical protein [Streptacidiphilus carbonis]